MTDVALGIATHGVPADADCETGLDVAVHIPVAGQPRSRGPTAVAIGCAEVPVDVTSLRALADLDTRRSVRFADATTAIIASVAHGPIHTAVAKARSGRWGTAHPERLSRSNRAYPAATLGPRRTRISVLRAKRRGARALSRNTQLRTAVGTLRARITQRSTRLVERSTDAAFALCAAAIRIRSTGLAVGL